jgi:rhodanese-related sulfurtransferase
MSVASVVVSILIFGACVGLALAYMRWRRGRFLKAHSIEAEQLHAILFAASEAGSVHVIDVRLPLDLLAYSEVIPGSRRIPPKEILENPGLLERDQETVVYCTCPSDKTASKIMQKAVSLGFERVRVLHGGLDAWKQKSYPVEPYESVFHLDTQS